jgi:hypothetical protein
MVPPSEDTFAIRGLIYQMSLRAGSLVAVVVMLKSPSNDRLSSRAISTS